MVNAHCLPCAPPDSEDLPDDDDSHDILWTPQAQALQALRPGIVHRLDKGTTGVLHQACRALSLNCSCLLAGCKVCMHRGRLCEA